VSNVTGGPVLMPKGKPSQVHKLIEGLHFQHFTQHFTCHRQYGENHVETLPANANLRQQHPYEGIGAYCRRRPRLCHPWRHEE
jgi:hypothetical protein